MVVGKIGGVFRDVVVLAMRLYFGVALVQSGMGKVQDPVSTANFFGQVGIPQPELAVYACIFGEVVGGACLAAGFFSRVFGMVVFINMTVAVLTAHADSVSALLAGDPSKFLAERAFLPWLTAVLVWGGGAGVWSLDFMMGGGGGGGSKPRQADKKKTN